MWWDGVNAVQGRGLGLGRGRGVFVQAPPLQAPAATQAIDSEDAGKKKKKLMKMLRQVCVNVMRPQGILYTQVSVGILYTQVPLYPGISRYSKFSAHICVNSSRFISSEDDLFSIVSKTVQVNSYR